MGAKNQDGLPKRDILDFNQKNLRQGKRCLEVVTTRAKVNSQLRKKYIIKLL